MFRSPLLEYSLWTVPFNLACLDSVQFCTKFTWIDRCFAA